MLKASHNVGTVTDKVYELETNPPRGGGILPDKRLMGMCSWMGSHFHDWSDYNGVTFSTELLGVAHFRIFCGRKTVLRIYGEQTYQNVCTADKK